MRKTHVNGVRLSESEGESLNAIQSYARSANVKLSDSGVVRALLAIAEPDMELVRLVQRTSATRKQVLLPTSINLKPEGTRKLQWLLDQVEMKLPRDVGPSGNDLIRAVLSRFRQLDLPLIGRLRQARMQELDVLQKQRLKRKEVRQRP